MRPSRNAILLLMDHATSGIHPLFGARERATTPSESERNGKHQARRSESEIVVVTVDTYVRAVQRDGQTTQGNGHQYNGSSEGLRLPFLGEPDKAGRQDNETPHFSLVEYTTSTPYETPGRLR
ncbi:hypothetical protein AOL_s00076g61 [Orbilia oligospora ATCC 24927]|uniref:Uncharacterized protein n=1 Tax=Arthrobotrys oligospora (strain ATCC 24927 / CBS 115.81 / DSM 1491) TaxID=756982 RepID=G1X8V4_ARTOA|nr:hypothetical protein AOL_s00076g61 [Orbilia oligospora ATCC 24927]EGX50297.1 hypothetical protein AOL_s00076g61 [Orbilia oligospora ATCC 24927]